MTELNSLTEKILRIRLAQMMVNENYKNGQFKIPIHLAFGHETIAVAMNEIMDEDGVNINSLNATEAYWIDMNSNDFLNPEDKTFLY
mgnify:CR=1 FL=1